MTDSTLIEIMRTWRTDKEATRLKLMLHFGVTEEKQRAAPGYYNDCMDMCADNIMDMIEGCEDPDCAMEAEEAMAGCIEGCNSML